MAFIADAKVLMACFLSFVIIDIDAVNKVNVSTKKGDANALESRQGDPAVGKEVADSARCSECHEPKAQGDSTRNIVSCASCHGESG